MASITKKNNTLTKTKHPSDLASSNLVSLETDITDLNEIVDLEITSISDDYVALVTDNVIICGTKSSDYGITLFTAVNNAEKVLRIKNVGTDTVTIDADGTETIDGALTYVLNIQYETVTITSNGTGWYII